MTTTDQTADPMKLARDALDAALFDLRRDDDERRSVPIVTRALAAIDALPVTKAFPLETVTRLPAERVTELFGRWVAARQQHPAPRGDALSMNEEFLLCLDAFDRQAEPSRSALDVEQLLRECVPGGSVCDPQQIADAIRAYCAALPASVQTVAWHMRVIGCDGSADWLEMGAAHPETPRGVEALPLVYAPASVPSGELAATIYVEVLKCPECQHVDINADDGAAACTSCDWHGPSPKNDHCPGCGSDGTMTMACTECGHRTVLLASATLPVSSSAITAQAAPAPAAVPAGMVLVPLRMTQAMRDITDAGEWEWADLLAAANAVTLEEYEAAQAAPAPAPTWAGSESGKLPPLPDTDWLLHMPAAQYEAEWTSSEEGYTADQMRAYALAARTQAPAAPAVAAPEPLPANMKACVLSAIECGIQVLEEVVTGRTLPRHAIRPVIERLAFAKKALKGEASLQTSPTPTAQEPQQ